MRNDEWTTENPAIEMIPVSHSDQRRDWLGRVRALDDLDFEEFGRIVTCGLRWASLRSTLPTRPV